MPIRTRPGLTSRRRGESLELPERFLFYPGQTWPHKNHDGLLEALALIRERHGETPPLVCSGHRNELQPSVEGRAKELGLQDSVRFVGFVEPLRLRCLYQLAPRSSSPADSRAGGCRSPRPSRWACRSPARTATSLPEVAGDAALLFDPQDTGEIAEAVWRCGRTPVARGSDPTVASGARPNSASTRAARIFRAHYRRIAGHHSRTGDRELIAGRAAETDRRIGVRSPAA